jgi:spore coat protein CotH
MVNKRLPLLLSITSVVLAIAVVAIVIFFPGLFTAKPSASAKPVPTEKPVPVVNELDRIFDPSKISQTFIELPQKSIDKLNSYNNEKYVAAKFKLTYDGTTTQQINVGIRIKGSTTHSRLNNLYYRPSFKIKFDWAPGYKTQTLFGKRSLTFNAFVQDNSRMHETYSYMAYRAMDVPAPRTGYTTITFEGETLPQKPNRGLYLVLESEDEEFFADHFQDVTQHVYENNHDVTDFDEAKVGGDIEVNTYFKVKQGWKATPNRDDLRALVKAANLSGTKFWRGLETVVDRERLVMLWAVDNFTGNWDTYSGPLRNNFTFRSNIAGKFTFVPWGTDQSFGENLFNDPSARVRIPGYRLPTKSNDDFFITVDKPWTAYPGSYLFAYSAGIRDMAKMENYQILRGKMFTKCLNHAPCATLYFQDLQKVNEWAKLQDYPAQMTATKALINKHLTAYQKAEAERTINWTPKQIKRIDEALKRNCKFDDTGLVTSCKDANGKW